MHEHDGARPERADRHWRVRLPSGARTLRVWINGVEQQEGADYVTEGSALRFSRPLAKEGKLGFWRWTLMALGIAGTYRKNDSVDVQYELRGRTVLGTGMEIEEAQHEKAR